jgi:class 3 adenylate cyclase/tetratricopeptide (TPR) repeat protein
MSGRRLTAILAADIAGYSALMSANEVDTVTALKGHQSVILPMVASFGGRVVDVAGDGVLAEFPSVLNAVKCAASIQEVMLERNTPVPPERRMRFRIGINQGDVLYDEHRIFGDGVNIAARLEGVCDPGGICISGKVYDEIKDRFDAPYDDIGEQYLKNIPSPVRAYKINFGGAPLGKQIKPPSKLALKLKLPRAFRLPLLRMPSFKTGSMRALHAGWIVATIVPVLLIGGGIAWWTMADEASDADDAKPAQQVAMNTQPPATPEPAPTPRPSQASVADRLQAEAALRPPVDTPPPRPPIESRPAPTQAAIPVPTPEAPRTAPEPTPEIEARPSTGNSYALQNVRPAPQIVDKPAGIPSIATPAARDDRPPLGDAQDVASLSRRGQQLAMKGEYTFAKLHFDEILLGRPQNVEALNDRCWVNAMLGDLPGALRDCDRALELRPNYFSALDSRGMVKLKLGKVREALADYEAATAIDGRQASALYGRGIAKRRLGNAAGGDADIARARQLKPDIANEFNGYGIR